MLLLTSRPGVSFFFIFRGEMQVCGFVDGLVGWWVIDLPLPSLLPPFVFCLCFWIQTTRHWGHQRSGGKMADEYLKCVGEVVLTLFCAENGSERERKTERERE